MRPSSWLWLSAVGQRRPAAADSRPKPHSTELLHLPIQQLEPVEELAQEQPSMAKADSVLKATLADNSKQTFILEFLTRWDEEKLLDLAQYTIFCKKKLRLHTEAVLILFTPHSLARSIYQDESITFRFRLLKLYEMDAGEVFARGIPQLYPLIPLMNGGVELAESANRKLIESDLPDLDKTALLAVLSVFLGLRDKDKARKILKEQRERMNVLAESPIFQEVLQMGRDEGEATGRLEGRAEGEARALRHAVLIVLKSRFGEKASVVSEALEKCSDPTLLDAALAGAANASSLQDFQQRHLPQG
jgi:hypothetical protein